MDIVKRAKEDIDIVNAIRYLNERSDINILNLLQELSEYMDQRADVRDHGEDVVGNTEMELGHDIDSLLFSLNKALGIKTV